MVSQHAASGKPCWESQKSEVSLVSSNPVSRVKTSENSPPLSVSTTGNSVPKHRRASAQALFESDDFCGDLGSAFIVQQNTDHEVAEGEIEGHDAFASDSSNHRIHFDLVANVVQFTVGNEILIGPADFKSGGNIRRVLLFSGLELDRPGADQWPQWRDNLFDISVNLDLDTPRLCVCRM